jgi:hypothetical protein
VEFYRCSSWGGCCLPGRQPGNGRPTQLPEKLREGADFFGKNVPFGGRNPLQMQPPLVNSQQPQDLPGFIDDFLTLYITFQVIAVTDVSAGYHHAVHAGAEGIE